MSNILKESATPWTAKGLRISGNTYLDCLFTYLSKLVEGNRGGGSGCAGCAVARSLFDELRSKTCSHPDFKTFRRPYNFKIWSFQMELFIFFNIKIHDQKYSRLR